MHEHAIIVVGREAGNVCNKIGKNGNETKSIVVGEIKKTLGDQRTVRSTQIPPGFLGEAWELITVALIQDVKRGPTY